jgi:hypothetical protein
VGKFHDIEIEIQSRFYRWAIRDAEREVREGYPLLRRIESRAVKTFLWYISETPQDEQLELVQALVKRAHDFRINRNDDALTPGERRLAEGYTQAVLDDISFNSFTKEGSIPFWVPRRKAGLPSRPKLKRKQFLNRVSEALRPVMAGSTERLTSENIWFERKYNKWTIRTSVYVGKPPHYRHLIRADWRDVLVTTITSWLGVGDGAWDVLYEDQSAEAAQTFGVLCAHFMTAIPEVLDGLDYDEATLLEPVPRR